MNWTIENTEIGSHIERGECRLWLTVKNDPDLTLFDLDTEEVVGMVEDGFLPRAWLGMREEVWERDCHAALVEYANDMGVVPRRPTFSIDAGVVF